MGFVMKILITGAGGFVGAHLIRFLKQNTEDDIFVTVLNEQEGKDIDLPVSRIYFLDINDSYAVEDIINKIKPDYMYHLAAQSSVGASWKIPSLTVSVNTVGTTNIFEAVRKSELKTRILLIGSSEQYGTVGKENLPTGETTPIQPSNPYAVSKIAQELMAKLYAKSYGLDIVTVRAFNHIGPGQSAAFVIPDWASQIAEIELGKREPVIRVGNTTVKRDLTDVRDVVRAYHMLMTMAKSGEVYNVGSGKNYKLSDILELMISQSQRPDIQIYNDKDKFRPSDTPEVLSNISKICEATGWQPEIGIEETIRDVIDYFRNTINFQE